MSLTDRVDVKALLIRIYIALLILGGLLVGALCPDLGATDFYAAANGSGTTCSFASPCSFGTVTHSSGYSAGPTIHNGDNIWLRGGQYEIVQQIAINFDAAIVTPAGAPVIIRNYNNEYVHINCGYDHSTQGNNNQCFGSNVWNSQNVWVWGLHFDNLSTATRVNTVDTIPPVPWRQEVVLAASGMRWINNWETNLADCVTTGDSWGDHRILYGNFCQYSGYLNTDRGHGHTWYIQNPWNCAAPGWQGLPNGVIGCLGGEAGRTLVQDNIGLRAFDMNYHQYGSNGEISYVTVDHNVEAVAGHSGSSFPTDDWPASGGGSQTTFLEGTSGNLATACTYPNNPKVNYYGIYNGNMSYDVAASSAAPFLAGYTKGSCNLTITNNYYAHTRSGTFTTNGTFPTLTLTGNTFMATPDGSGATPGTLAFTQANYPNNTYLSGHPSSGKQFFYRPNQYETGRGFVAVYNWDLSANVTIDLAQMGGYPGEQYKIFGYQDNIPWSSTPIATGTCGTPCGTISVPTSGLSVGQPKGTGRDGSTPFPKPVETGPKFNVYIIYPDWGVATPPTPTNTNTPTRTSTSTPTLTPSLTLTPSFTATRTYTPTGTLTPSPTFTYTPTNTKTLTPSATSTPSRTPTPYVPIVSQELVIEAEATAAVLTAPMEKHIDSAASGGVYVSSAVSGQTDVNAGGILRFNFHIPVEGDYVVWARVYGPTASSDSLYVSYNGETITTTTHIFDLLDSRDCTTNDSWRRPEAVWAYVKVNDRTANCSGTTNSYGYPRVFHMTVGDQYLTFSGREPGARLDKIIITSNQDYDPNYLPMEGGTAGARPVRFKVQPTVRPQ